MADVLSKSNMSSLVFDNGSASISHRRRNLSAVRFVRCKSKSFEGLRSSPSSCLKSNGFLGRRLDFGDPCGKGVRANRLATPVQVCQFAEQNPDVLFLHVNYEEHKSMCYSLNVHVLPFFRFYRGANGRLCSFSCTNATIKKFKDALAKHSTERCSLGPAKGLEESEIQALAGNRDLSFTYPRKPASLPSVYDVAEAVPVVPKFPLAQPPSRAAREPKDKTLVGGGR